MSATRERTREVFGFKKENLENPNVILYQQEVGKFRRDYKELWEASKSWMDAIAKMRVEGELLSSAYGNFGETTYHKEGENLSKIHRYLDMFNNNAKNLYENVEDNYFNPINDVYKFQLKNIDEHDSKTHHDKLAYEDAMTVYHKPMYHETEQKSRDRFNKMTTAQSVFQADFVQYMQLVADLESKSEYQIPQAFRNLMNALEDFFEKGRHDFGYIDIPDWKRSDAKDSMLDSTLNQKHTDWNKKFDAPVASNTLNANGSTSVYETDSSLASGSTSVYEKETVETTEEISSTGDVTKTTTSSTKTTTTAPLSNIETPIVKSDLIGNPMN